VLLTLNQVISQITTLGAAHLQIQSTGVGDFAEWQALERAYPLLWVFHETTSIGDRELVYSIRLVCADRVITGEEGDDTAGMEQEVLSDTLLILLDFLAYFQQQHAQSYKVITSASIDPFTERFNDRVAGNSVLIQIRQPFTWDACQIPQTGATIPPSVDGLTLYDFCDPSVIARLTPSQVACLEAEYGITCVDATVTQNGNAFFTVPAGATYPLVTKLDGANSLGSFNAGTKTLSFTSNPSNLQINGAQSEIIPGNSTFNLLAKLDGVAGGVYNAGLDTLNFTTTPAILQRNAIQIKTLANASTFNLITKLDGAANNGTWDGVDTLDFTSAPCSPVTFQINAVNKESITSGSTFNLITKLDGSVNSGSYDAPTDTLSFTSASPPPSSVSLTVSDTTPDFRQTITLTATPSNITPTLYTFFTFDGVTIQLIVEQVGAVYNWTANRSGTYDVYVLATDGINNVYALSEITVAIDPDVAAFLLATGITDPVIQGAIEQLVGNLKGFSLWAKMLAIYPLVGGTATTHKWNLKNPLDTNNAYRLVFNGGVTHNSNGITGNGSNAYASTFLQDASLNINNKHISIYQRNVLPGESNVSMGTNSVTNRFFLSSGGANYSTFGMSQAPMTINNPQTGMFTMSKIISGEFKFYQNSLTPITRTGTNESSINNYSLLADTSGGFPSIANLSFASIGEGFSVTEVTNLYTSVQAFQTALGRQV
jgi:hypothetical protein